ncbi:CBS domain-containing protein CBSX1, chloroplastic-like isoform X2 [Syzygium oleosum]|uniref:CBS domain-containing protein CBSX1, chloroplastic-like isoform X2 n=1 Tax=Syzygium oleosum TaxID=219896 RepID=UPI0024B89BE8|nr:CBS domain-containing protein CBSX1, chloroplastic-like isoform X2 [Syzygium oleosum]
MGSFSFTSPLHSMQLFGLASFSDKNHELPRTYLATYRCNRRSFDFPGGNLSRRRYRQSVPVAAVGASVTNSVQPRNGAYTVGDFMTRKEYLHVVKATTTVDEALEMLVEKRITGFPVIDDDWTLVGVVSDYDLLALDSISGGSQGDANIFPDVDSSWKAFNRIQRLLSKTHGKVVGDLMTPAPLVVRETTNLEDAARLLLETKYRRLPVVDGNGKLIGIITRGNVVRAALQMKHANKHSS